MRPNNTHGISINGSIMVKRIMTRLTLSDISDNKFALAGLPLAKFIYADEEDAGQFVKKERGTDLLKNVGKSNQMD